MRGVEIVSQPELEKIGKIKTLIHLPGAKPLNREQVLPFLNKAYDSEFSWNSDRIYCSELVGKLLAIPPQPMTFKSPVWNGRFQSLEGKPGLSPDDIYEFLVKKIKR